MTPLGIIVMTTGTVTILVGIVALFRSTRPVDYVGRSRAVFRSMCIVGAGIVVGYIGVSIDTGQSPSAAFISAAAIVAIAGAVWRANVVRAERGEARHRDEEEKR